MGKQKGVTKKEPESEAKSKAPDEDKHDDVLINSNKKKMSRFKMLQMEDDDPNDDDDPHSDKKDDDDDDDEKKSELKSANSKGKKSKKEKRKKKDDDDDDELNAMLEELAMEIEGKKPINKAQDNVEKDPSAKGDAGAEEGLKDNIDKEKDKKKREGNKQTNKTDKTDKTNTTDTTDTANDDAKLSQENNEKSIKTKKKKNKTPAVEKVEKRDDEKTNDVKDDTEVHEHNDDVDDGTEEKSKKKKGKKDKDKDAKDKDKKGPGKKQIALMQEILRKQKEEEERAMREEEERIKREEEEERLRQEKIRLEAERKERKKQKEKERKERLKKEGKLLTAKQKADRQRAQLSLEIAKREGRVIVGRDRTKRQGSVETNPDTPNVNHANDSKHNLNIVKQSSDEQTDDKDNNEDEVDDDEDDVKEDWEEMLIENGDAVKNDKNTAIVKDNEKVKSLSIESKAGAIIAPIKEISPEPIKPKLRSPIVCVLGHVDTGKTKLLDYIRKSHVQDNEAGGITQQIGATFVPPVAIEEQTRGVRTKVELCLPGLLIIDTPGHESFTNLRSRGSSLCDIAILVIDIMHGIEQQTLESINLLKARKTPFIVALNKIDRLYNWKGNARRDVEDVINSQQPNAKVEFNDRCKETILQLANLALNAALFYENKDLRSYVSLVPTSAATGDGMGNLISLLVSLTQSMMSKKLTFDSENLEATVLEVKAIPGLGTTIDVILVNGKLNEGDKIVLAGHDGPIVTHIRSLLVPQPLRELRVKSPYQELKCVYGSMGVKVAGHDLEKAVAGLQLYVAKSDSEIEDLQTQCWQQFGNAMKQIKCSEKGVYVQASTLGSLEALLEFLKTSKIPYCGVRIGPVVKRDVMRASIMLENSPDYAVILAFDVKIERDAQELAENLGVKIFHAEIIYHLFDKFTAYREDLKKQRREQNKHLAVYPCKLRILPNCIFNTRDPIVVGVCIEDGIVVPGTPLAVPSKGGLEIGRVSTIEINHKAMESARRGQEVCLKIEHCGGDAPKLYGRHFDYHDILASRITRESINVMKEYFRDDLIKTDWQLMIELKKMFEII